MADSFRASFVLALKDDLSGGLRRIIAETKQLRELVRSLGFRPLEGADAIVGRLDRDLQQLNRDLGTTARQAEAAGAALRRTSAAELGRAQQDAAGLRRQAALARQAQAAAGSAGGAAIPLGGRQLLLSGPGAGGPIRRGPAGSSAAGGAPLLLTGPDAPYDERFNTLRRRPLRDALGGVRERVGAFRDSVGLAEGALAGVSLMEPIREAAEFDNVLTHIAITAGATEETVRAKVASMAETYRAMALATKQSSHDVAEAGMFMITTGMSGDLVNQLLPMMAKASTAYSTPLADTRQGAFAIQEGLKIKPEDMLSALSATALAGRQGHFYFSDFSQFLPEIIPLAGKQYEGRGGLDVLLAALEASRRRAGTSGQASTNLKQYLGDISGGSRHANRAFAKQGIDLPELLRNAEAAGQYPLEAVTEAVRKRTATMSPARQSAFIGSLFGNQESRIFQQAMLSELDFYQQVKNKVATASDQVIEEDFRKAQNLHTRLAELSESSHQLTQRIGTGFSWVVPIGTGLIEGVLTGLHGMDQVLPGVADGVIGLTGGMLGLVAVLGAIGFVAKPVKAGWELFGGTLKRVFSLNTLRALLNPWLAIVLLTVAAAKDIIEHWDYFRRDFYRLWGGILQVMRGVGEFFTGVFAGDMEQAVRGLGRVWDGVRQAWTSLWGPRGIMERLFGDFASRVDSWSGGMATGFGRGIAGAIDAALPAIRAALQRVRDLFDAMRPAPLPDHPFMVPQGGPDSFPRYEPHGQGGAPVAPTQPSQPAMPTLPAQRSAWHGGPISGPHGIHIRFEADLPGRVRVRHLDPDGVARGPMLDRA